MEKITIQIGTGWADYSDSLNLGHLYGLVVDFHGILNC